MLKKEDIEFLKKLKEDMINGNTCCQANPRYWAIMDYEKRAVPDGYADETEIIGNGESYTLDEFKEYVIDNYTDELDDEKEQEKFVDEINSSYDLSDMQFVMLEYGLNDLKDYEEIYVKECGFISTQSGAFLTKEDCDKHLKANYYHYSSKAHSYALTGWRNPRFEKLLDIILKTNWSE